MCKEQYEMLAKAIARASEAHKNHFDLEGQPYVLHLFRVSQRCYPDIDAMIVGILHDIVEDTDVKLKEIKAEFPEHIATAVGLLTHDKGDTYIEYVENLKTNDLARKVKFADLEDNLDPRRLRFMRLRFKKLDVDFNAWVARHHRAYGVLTDYEEYLKETETKNNQVSKQTV